jgi:hypothetical protein
MFFLPDDGSDEPPEFEDGLPEPELPEPVDPPAVFEALFPLEQAASASEIAVNNASSKIAPFLMLPSPSVSLSSFLNDTFSIVCPS